MSKFIKFLILWSLVFVNQISVAQTFRGFIFQIYYLNNESAVVNSDTEPSDRFYLDSSNFKTANFRTFKMPTTTLHYTVAFNDELNSMLSKKLHIIPFNTKRFLFLDDGCYSKYASYLHSKINAGKSINLIIDTSFTIRVCVNKVEFEGCNLKKSIYDEEGFMNMIAIGSNVKEVEFSESDFLAFQTFSKLLLDSLHKK